MCVETTIGMDINPPSSSSAIEAMTQPDWEIRGKAPQPVLVEES